MKTGERLVTERNRRLLLRRRPVGLPVPEDFELVEEALPIPRDGAILVRNHLCSLDPGIRGWLDDAPSYIPPIALNDAVRAITVGHIVTSLHPGFQTGNWVVGMNAIEDYSIATPDGFLRTIDPDSVSSITLYLSVQGALGVTAYFGVMDVCRPRPGETMLINGAAGAVGSLVGQIARIKGCRTIGIAGGPAKCKRLIERYGFDAAIDYRGKSSSALSAELAAAAPDGVDMVFENVGGLLLDTALMHLKPHARVALCGLISEYNSTTGPIGARNLWQLIVKRATIQGLFLGDFLHRSAEAHAALAGWIKGGLLVVDEHIEEGIENAVPAFLRLFSGTHEGKLILRIAA
jgi:NADPH-dependent curcumin reductase CurA